MQHKLYLFIHACIFFCLQICQVDIKYDKSESLESYRSTFVLSLKVYLIISAIDFFGLIFFVYSRQAFTM